MRPYYFVFIGLCLIACNNNGASNEKKNNDESVSHSTSEVLENIRPIQLTATAVPSECNITGSFNEAWQWKDKLGDHILITSTVPEYSENKKNEDGETTRAAELFAVLYLKKGDKYELVWNLNDAQKDCIFDITAEFLKGATTITDLDHNGIAEAKFQYALACRSDVSPAYMKLVMYEGEKKYSLNGLRWVKESPEDEFPITEQNVDLEKIPKQKDEFEQWKQSCGRYESEKDFEYSPPEFLTYARAEWLKYAKESMGEE